MNETKLHRPIWHTPSSGGSKSPSFCRSCGIRRGQPSSHPVHYAERDERGAWATYCRRYGEWTATGLSFASADKLAKDNESGSEPCGCEPQPTEDEVIEAALAALAAGDPQPVLNAAASGILPTDAPVVAQAWALAAAGHVTPQAVAHVVTDTIPASDGPCVVCGQHFPPDAPWSSGHDGAGEHRCHVEPEPVAMDFRVVDAGRSGPTAATTVRVYGDTTGGAILDLSRNYAVPAPHGMLGEVILTPAEVDHLIAALQQTKRS